VRKSSSPLIKKRKEGASDWKMSGSSAGEGLYQLAGEGAHRRNGKVMRKGIAGKDDAGKQDRL